MAEGCPWRLAIRATSRRASGSGAASYRKEGNYVSGHNETDHTPNRSWNTSRWLCLLMLQHELARAAAAGHVVAQNVVRLLPRMIRLSYKNVCCPALFTRRLFIHYHGSTELSQQPSLWSFQSLHMELVHAMPYSGEATESPVLGINTGCLESGRWSLSRTAQGPSLMQHLTLYHLKIS